MSDINHLMVCLGQAERQLAAINREPDYALESLHAETAEEGERLDNLERLQDIARVKVEQEIASLKQSLAKLSEASETDAVETETSEMAKE